MKLQVFCGLFVTFGLFADTVQAEKIFLSSDIVEEVISASPHPFAYDWREMSLELELGYDYIDEANNFDTDGLHFMVGLPVSYNMAARFGVRRYWVYTTPSSDLMGRTPFQQAARSNRYEIVGEGNYALFQGRMMSALSPLISDSEHVLFGTAGLHFSHENAGNVPAKSDVPAVMPGQKNVHSRFVMEFGARWHIYFPNALGTYFVMQRQIPLGGTAELRHWTHFSMGLLWAFGGN